MFVYHKLSCGNCISYHQKKVRKPVKCCIIFSEVFENVFFLHFFISVVNAWLVENNNYRSNYSKNYLKFLIFLNKPFGDLSLKKKKCYITLINLSPKPLLRLIESTFCYGVFNLEGVVIINMTSPRSQILNHDLGS